MQEIAYDQLSLVERQHLHNHATEGVDPVTRFSTFAQTTSGRARRWRRRAAWESDQRAASGWEGTCCRTLAVIFGPVE
jgi:hypothetical protein